MSFELSADHEIFRKVVRDFADAYARGETPIPCVECNRSVKFRDLLATARDLAAKEGIFAGISTGGILHAALAVAEKAGSSAMPWSGTPTGRCGSRPSRAIARATSSRS